MKNQTANAANTVESSKSQVPANPSAPELPMNPELSTCPELPMNPELPTCPSAPESSPRQLIKTEYANPATSLDPIRRRRVDDLPPVLRFTPTAWAKLQYLCHRGDTEIGGFGLAPAGDLLLVEDFATIPQITSAVSVQFDDAAVGDFFETQVDSGRKPEQFARLWVHTHPGDSPLPSSLDEETFARVFGTCDWAVMFILARGGRTFARLRFNVGPKGHMLIPVEVDYGVPFAGSDHGLWEREYRGNIHAMDWADRWPKRDDANRKKGKRSDSADEAAPAAADDSAVDPAAADEADLAAWRELDDLQGHEWLDTLEDDAEYAHAAAMDQAARDDFFAVMKEFYD